MTGAACNHAGFLRQRSNLVGGSNMQDQQPLQYRRMSLDNMGTYHQANLAGEPPAARASLHCYVGCPEPLHASAAPHLCCCRHHGTSGKASQGHRQPCLLRRHSGACSAQAWTPACWRR